jgi:hypothetical protein
LLRTARSTAARSTAARHRLNDGRRSCHAVAARRCPVSYFASLSVRGTSRSLRRVNLFTSLVRMLSTTQLPCSSSPGYVQWQVAGVDHAAGNPQVVRHQLAGVRQDEHPLHVQLDTLAGTGAATSRSGLGGGLRAHAAVVHPVPAWCTYAGGSEKSLMAPIPSATRARDHPVSLTTRLSRAAARAFRSK